MRSSRPGSTPRRPDPLDQAAIAAAEARQNALTKPPGALGRLEALAIHLAGVQGTPLPESRPAAAILFASDHPVSRHGVSAYPAAVTRAMLGNFVRGGAAANVLCRQLGVPLLVVDVGVGVEAPPPSTGPSPSALQVSPARTLPVGDLRVEDAMPQATFEAALETGRRAVADLHPAPKVLVLGEMGIGNTTPASAVTAALLGLPAAEVVGRGTGLDEEGLLRKRAVVDDALDRVAADDGEPEPSPWQVLRRLGGRELAAVAGAAVEAGRRRIAVLLDGFIVAAAVLAAVRAEPWLVPFLVPGHRSREPGHRRALDAIFEQVSAPHAEPLLDLDLALGEGSGALCALALVDLALATHREMATFDEAGVPRRVEPR
ncbi:MAG TPA: nicotinate-nucleotide--dimethylbenzimidazole phosphoribosyltransferase [Polyangiaceae bacterium LLY-WYZ-14_1]|nr:nicotinate-nucleotide--dimethylbenzimidazole phosphoribosyltransferase [Polyangiaceae bacterium LLY-WYZ-14_1]